MLRMIISCGGGMSSSALTMHIQNEIKEKNLEDEVEVEFLAFPLFMGATETALPLGQKQLNVKDFDIAFLCPHLLYYAKNSIKDLPIPCCIIPSLMYGTMRLNDLIEDAHDLLALYKDSDEKLMHFPEEKLLDIKRNVSHRKWIQTHPVK